jgi:O-antigen biosynthesis protein WbqP
MKRIFDVLFSVLFMIILSPMYLLILILIKLTSKGPGLYWSKRIGKDCREFLMPKFRTMKVNTPQVATHLLTNSDHYITPIGSFLRKSSLDEIPQLWSILKGDMSFVGPRPALFNQFDLISYRKEKGIDHLLPGLTGLAQINGRDDIPLTLKVRFDHEYLLKKSFLFDLRIIFLTIYKVIMKSGISH